MRALIRGLDSLLRRLYGVFDISNDPDCLLRLQIAEAPHDLRFSDQVVAAGESVLIIHIWNEHLLSISPQGPDLAWAKKMYRTFYNSLHEVACWIEKDSNSHGIAAVGGVSILVFTGSRTSGARFLEGLGFTIMPYSNPLGRFGEFWENFYSWMLIWTFNPGSLPHHRMAEMRRDEFWIPVEGFLRRYSEKSSTPAVLSEKQRG
jgi:hypothetical protein